MNPKLIVLVGIGGMIGSVCRYAIGLWIKNNPFPYATFWVNISGALIIGACMAWYQKFPEQEPLKLFLVTGICGVLPLFRPLPGKIGNYYTTNDIFFFVSIVLAP